MKSDIKRKSTADEVSDEELLKVIADFLEMGHVENIVAMFKQEPRYYQWTGDLLLDERFAVRLGVSVLFEYLADERPDQVKLAVPSLAKVLNHEMPLVRGEAVSVLAIIGSDDARNLIGTMTDDPAPEVAGLAVDILAEGEQ